MKISSCLDWVTFIIDLECISGITSVRIFSGYYTQTSINFLRVLNHINREWSTLSSCNICINIDGLSFCAKDSYRQASCIHIKLNSSTLIHYNDLHSVVHLHTKMVIHQNDFMCPYQICTGRMKVNFLNRLLTRSQAWRYNCGEVFIATVVFLELHFGISIQKYRLSGILKLFAPCSWGWHRNDGGSNKYP